MIPCEMQERLWVLESRLNDCMWKTAIVVQVASHHTQHLSTTIGPSSCINKETREWIESRGLIYGGVMPGFWTETWPQLDDDDPRNLVYFSVYDHEIALLFKLTFGGS